MFSLLDIDECMMGTHDCSQICSNNEGSFTCGCPAGYLLAADRKTCIGLYSIYHTLNLMLFGVWVKILACFLFMLCLCFSLTQGCSKLLFKFPRVS